MAWRAPLVTIGLLGLLVLVQGQLWFSRGSVPQVMALNARLAEQRDANEAARARNEQLAAEVRDLEQGLEMVEEKARVELGMVRPNEILVHVTTPKP